LQRVQSQSQRVASQSSTEMEIGSTNKWQQFHSLIYPQT